MRQKKYLISFAFLQYALPRPKKKYQSNYFLLWKWMKKEAALFWKCFKRAVCCLGSPQLRVCLYGSTKLLW